MNSIIKENIFFKNKLLIVLLLFIYILLLLPFLGNIAFDAVVHFVVAERFAEGHPFLYNINDTETVIASTSPFWTIFLTFFYYFTGQFAPLIVKSICILLWLSSGYLLNIAARDIWRMKDFTRYAVLFMWFANISIVKNSLGGLENILSAFQLLLLYYYLWKNLYVANYKSDFIIGILLGLTILTRLDAGTLALIIVFVYLTAKRLALKYNFIKSLLIIVLISLVVLLPWYLYQYSYTAKILSDSSVARLFTGRRNSIDIFNGLLYFHPNAFTILGTAFLPFSIGFLFSMYLSLKSKFKEFNANFHAISCLVIVICSVLAYSFIVGADQFGRYFLITISFFLLAGFNGLQSIHSALKAKNIKYSNILVSSVIIFLLLTNAYDYFQRVINIGQLESNIYEIFYAPSKRIEVTANTFQKLGIDTNQTIKLAITEVQFKYFVDERINVISLDGRSSSKILNYMNKNGLPDFERFIEDEKPDIVEVKGWPYKGNLLYSWEEKLKGMKIGESFFWKNNKITYVTPWHVKILYNFNK